MKTIKIKNFLMANNLPFTLIAGPCQIESEAHCFMIAEHLKKVCTDLNINLIFKSSYDKANRLSLTSKRGVGMKEGLRILKGIKEELNLPIITDVHETIQCEKAAQVADILQIPSFLCRQTDLVIAAAETGKVVNIKKGQFLGPQMMQNLAAKAASTGNDNIMFTERGTTFGFGGLVVDITGFPIMGHAGYPLIIDATHAVQQPGSAGATTGGNRDHVEVLARAALSTGIMAGVFLETHDDPDNAPSDGPNSIRLEDMKSLLEKLKLIDSVAKNIPVKF